MSWPMPTMGPWNSNVPPGPPMNPESNMEHWAAMQQQSWDQWAQWQQQYTQWQIQYGDKYSQGMQAMLGMPPGMGGMGGTGGMGGVGGMGFPAPFMPMSTGVPPVPPPPDNPPPPPPPYENDQPLYGPPQSNVTAPAPGSNHLMNENTNLGGDNNVNNQSQQSSQKNMDNSYAQPLSASTAAALKKLDEKERLFDIHFKKWEEEIEKWKKDNANHPDKQAYKEYQDKFEACRAKLLERRKQMTKKRAKLLGNTPPTNNLPNSSNVFQGKSLNADQYNNSSAKQSQNSITSHYQPYSDTSECYFNGPGAWYQYNSNPYFLASSKYNEGIPGLDLVPPDRNSQNKNEIVVIDITQDDTEINRLNAPDYSKMSNGINNILDDEKIMQAMNVSLAQNNQEPFDQRSNDKYYYNQWNNQRDGNDMYSNDQYEHRSINRQITMNNQFQQQGQGPVSQNFNQCSSHNQEPGTQVTPSLMNIPILPPPNFSIPGSEPQSYGTQNFGPQQYDQFQNQGYGSGTRGPGGNLMQNQPPNNFNYQNEDYAPPRQQDFGQQQYNVPPPMRGRGPALAQGTGPPLIQVRDPPPSMDYINMRTNMSQDPSQNYSNEPPKSICFEKPFLTPSIIVDYEHKPLRLEARNFIEPVYTFDYNHTYIHKDEKTIDYRLEDDRTLIMRRTRRTVYDELVFERPTKDFHHNPPPQDFEMRSLRATQEWSYGDDRNIPARQRFESRFEERRFDERTRRDEYFDDGDSGRRKPSLYSREYTLREDHKRDDRRRGDSVSGDDRNQNSIRGNDSLKRSYVDNNMGSSVPKKSKDGIGGSGGNDRRTQTVMIEDILDMPGRELRPEKIVIILRGPPGSGKSYLAKLIRDNEAEYGVTARIMSIDDYFIQETEVEDKDPNTGKIGKKMEIQYVYEQHLEETYLNSLKRAFKRTLSENFYPFIIYDAINDTPQSYGDIWNITCQHGFQVYVCTMELDVETCFKRNIHNRSLDDIQVICSRFCPTPLHHTVLDATTWLQNAPIIKEQMEDIDNEYDDGIMFENAQDPELISTVPAIDYECGDSSWKHFYQD